MALSRKTPMRRAGGIKPKKRSASEFRRIYGSRQRVEAIKAMRCTVPHCPHGPCHNAHTEGGGMGRKAGWETIVPLCPTHHFTLDSGLGSVRLFDEVHQTDIAATAARLALLVTP